jgi:DNA repair exonuclease SbcCD nuclease subunit
LNDFKFLHVADIHLDSPLLGLARYEGVPVDEVRSATRVALTNLVDLAIEEQVAFVIIAGDIYDGDWPDFGTGLYFCAAMGRLEKAGIDVYLLYGNHDAQSVLTKKLPLPPNVHLFTANKVATFTHEVTGAVLHGRSYREKDTRENLAIQYPPATPGAFDIGVLHTALNGGRPPHAPYAPCSLAELTAKGYQYWALGHVHDFEIVSESPYVVYPGNVQGRSVRECGPRGVVIVTVQDNEIASPPERLSVDSVRWARVEVDLTTVSSENEVHLRIRSALEFAMDRESEGRPLVARISIVGATPLHGWLSESKDQLQQDIRGIAISLSEQLWIEKIIIKTQAPAQAKVGDSTTVDEIGALLASGSENPEIIERLKEDLEEFLSRLPAEVGSDDEVVTAVRAGEFGTLLEAAATALTARLGGGEV